MIKNFLKLDDLKYLCILILYQLKQHSFQLFHDLYFDLIFIVLSNVLYYVINLDFLKETLYSIWMELNVLYCNGFAEHNLALYLFYQAQID